MLIQVGRWLLLSYYSGRSERSGTSGVGGQVSGLVKGTSLGWIDRLLSKTHSCPVCTPRGLCVWYVCMCLCECTFVNSHIPVQLSEDVLRRMRESQGSDSAKPPPSPPDSHKPPPSKSQSKSFPFPQREAHCVSKHVTDETSIRIKVSSAAVGLFQSTVNMVSESPCLDLPHCVTQIHVP